MVIHTVQIQSKLSGLLSNLQDAETGQRGFLLTHNDDYLEPYFKANASLNKIKNNLRFLTQDNLIQQKNLDRMEMLVTQKLNELKQTIELSKKGNHDEAIKIVKSNYGKKTMDNIRVLIGDMSKLETSLLKQRKEKFDLITNFVWIAEILTFIAFLTIAFLVLKQINTSFKLQATNQRSLSKLNKDLQQSNQELEKFAYVASHDLKAPLRGINNLANWIEEDLKEALQGEAKNNMSLLHNRIKRLESLLDDLLAYSRVERSKDKKTIVNCKSLVEEIASLYQSPGLDLKIKTDDSLPTITTIRGPLEQIFRNLIHNAIKHHDRTSINIEITAEENAEFITFSVKDDGPGIPTEYHNQIFEMFKTLKSRDEVEGSGMGLAIIKKVLDIHGGKIHVESQRGIRGANFIFDWKKII